MVDKPHCLDARIFNEKLVGIEMQKVKGLLIKPSYVGFVVFQLSKLHMLKYVYPASHHILSHFLTFHIYVKSQPFIDVIIVLIRFHNDVIKSLYGVKDHLLFRDTECLMYHIERADSYKDMFQMKEHFDMSHFEATNPYYEPGFAADKAVVGKMKDEVAACQIAEFVRLRLRMYSFDAVRTNPDRTKERLEKQRAKGIQRAAAERFLYQQYLGQLHNPTENNALNRRLGSRRHQIYCIEVSAPTPHVTDQTLTCNHPFLNMPSAVPTRKVLFLNISRSVH